MGMIVVGFPGIGKTSISFGKNNFVRSGELLL